MARYVQDDDRRTLEAALQRTLGPEPAETVMALLPPVDWSEFARQSDLLAVRGDVDALKTDVAELKTDVAELKVGVAGLKTGVAELKTDMAAMRTDYTDFRHEARNDLIVIKADNKAFVSEVTQELSKMRVDMLTQFNELWFRLFFTIIGAMIGLGGIVMAAAKL